MLTTVSEKLWYGNHFLRWILWPIAIIYRIITECRRVYLQRFRQKTFPVPVIVVGNLTVGGVGKTPLVIALAKEFQLRGLRVGIVSRGYGARVSHFPHEVRCEEHATQVGDEPLLLARNTGCPVVIAPKRVAAVQYLLDHHQSQIIISDDGLQHYRMGRALEIVVIDAFRGLGNGLCIPAGPLREGVSRLQTSNFVVVNGNGAQSMIAPMGKSTYRMELLPGVLTHLRTGESRAYTDFKDPVAAVAGIGNPQRFFVTLKQLGIAFHAYPFADHYSFKPEDFFFTEDIIVMTEKDAVKCKAFATDNMYFLPVTSQLDAQFWDALWADQQLQGYL